MCPHPGRRVAVTRVCVGSDRVDLTDPTVSLVILSSFPLSKILSSAFMSGRDRRFFLLVLWTVVRPQRLPVSLSRVEHVTGLRRAESPL